MGRTWTCRRKRSGLSREGGLVGGGAARADKDLGCMGTPRGLTELSGQVG